MSRTRRKIGSFLAVVSVLFLVVWILREVLMLSSYGAYIIIMAMLFGLAAKLVSIDVDRGAAYAAAQLIGKIGTFLITFAVVFWILGWLGLEERFTSLELPFIVAGFLLVVASIAAYRLVGMPKMVELIEKPYLFRSTKIYEGGGVRVWLPREMPGFIVKIFGRKRGAIFFGDVFVEMDTEVGPIRVTLGPPVFIKGFSAEKLGSKMGMRDLAKYGVGDMLRKAIEAVDRIVDRGTIKGRDIISLPFIHIESGEDEDYIKVGPIEIHSSPEEEYIDMPFLRIYSSEKKVRRGLRIYGLGEPEGEVVIRRGRVKVRWNDHKVVKKDDFLEISVGGDRAVISPSYIKLESNGYSIKIGSRSATINFPNLNVVIRGGLIRVVTERRVVKAEDQELAARLINNLGEVARDQLSNLLHGLPLDLTEVFDRVEDIMGEML